MDLAPPADIDEAVDELKRVLPRTALAIEIHIPVLPPSANDMNEYGKGRVFNSKAYKNWRYNAGLIVKSQKPAGIVGPYKLTIQAERPAKRRDLDNILKPISDLLQDAGVIANDCYCEMISARWLTQMDGISVRVERAGVQ